MKKLRKARLLWFLPLPLVPATVIALVGGHFTAFAANAGAYGLFLAGAILTHRGFLQEAKQQQPQFQTTGRRPFKLLGGLTVALATALTAWAGAGHSEVIALAFGGGALAGFVLFYGLDARRSIIVVANRDGDMQRITTALHQAEQKIRSIEQAGSRINQPELNQRLTRIVAMARNILMEIANDPRDLQRARKFLNTYLDGTQRVVAGYAKAHADLRSQTLETNFRRVLITIEEVFGQQHQHLLENDRRDLDVSMEVLATQLKHEGLN
ncbi:MAG: 5-bromo-4-chloroindolyl phosphate hydrolase [Desulfobulbaceae bacterium]|nr:MAG: 5-bromo-4-chloroindolyl phosphate hydrolase [Desulfobulbaceae bacterium]